MTESDRAVQYRPEDPVINYHLGDALWQVGRKNKARFPGRLSLCLNPATEGKKRVRRILENGISPATNSVIMKELSTPKPKS